MASADLELLNKLMNTFKREEPLDFGDGKHIKKMKVAVWNLSTSSQEMSTMIPKL